jgi:hypothetical protein
LVPSSRSLINDAVLSFFHAELISCIDV